MMSMRETMQQKLLRVEDRREDASALLTVLEQISGSEFLALSADDKMLSIEAQRYIKQLQPVAEQIHKTVEEQILAEGDPTPIDERCFAGVSDDKMLAWSMILPRAFSGNALTKQELQQALAQQNIIYGMDEAVIQQMLEAPQKGRLYVVANGTTPCDGENGKVIEHFEREKKASFAVNETDKVNYKNLNLIQQVKADEVICTIIPATPGTDGMTVTGLVVQAKPGNPPFVPIGKNTELNEDQTELRAKCEGQIRYVNQAFQVEQVMTIGGDVDSTVGNIDVIGTVEIAGNVMEGFTVKATGDINIRGTVENANLHAGKNIRIATGVKGSANSSIHAKGDIKCKYIENCRMHAGGSITADMIINSTIACNGHVEAKNGRGVIIGGVISARESVSAKVIGNEVNRKITISVGNDPDYFTKKKDLSSQMHNIKRSVEETQKNVEYLESFKGALDAEYQKLFSDLNLKLTVEKVQAIKLEKALLKLQKEQNPAGSFIEATKIFPPVQVNIGSLNYIVDNTQNMCRIYMADGEIKVGTK